MYTRQNKPSHFYISPLEKQHEIKHQLVVVQGDVGSDGLGLFRCLLNSLKNGAIKHLLLIATILSAPDISFGMSNQKDLDYISYFSSSSPTNKYCSGNEMDSNAFRKTITRLKTTAISTEGLSQQQILNKTIEAASGAHNLVIKTFSTNKQNLITFRGGTAAIAAIDGWAGISIFMCSWVPLVEVNLGHFPFVKKIVWKSER